MIKFLRFFSCRVFDASLSPSFTTTFFRCNTLGPPVAKSHLKKYHYGHDIEESALDTVLEELFLNENNKQSTSAD